MGFFSFKKKSKITIHKQESDWVNQTFKLLISGLGIERNNHKQIKFSREFFPNTFAGSNTLIKAIIIDLTNILELNDVNIKYDIQEDLRDIYGVEFETTGNLFECSLDYDENCYQLHIANSIVNESHRLVYCLIKEFSLIKLNEVAKDYDFNVDPGMFVYLVGIYLGFGVILAQNLADIRSYEDGDYRVNKTYISEMPLELMAFSLAYNSKLIGLDKPSWVGELPKPIDQFYQDSIELMEENDLFNITSDDIRVWNSFYQADTHYNKYEFEEANEILKNIDTSFSTIKIQSEVADSIGYNYLRMNNFEKSREYFQLAKELDPMNGYSISNLGYVLLRLGEIEDSRELNELALTFKLNITSYIYRNIALYHLMKNELVESEKFFDLALDFDDNNVDYLEYHYAELLIAKGEIDKAKKYLRISIKKKEKEGINLMNRIDNDN